MSDVNVKVGLTSAEFKAGLDKMKGQLAKWKDEQVSAFKGLGSNLAGILTVDAAIEFTKSLVGMGREIRETANEAGLSSESFQQWTKVLGKFGADQDTVVMGFKKLSGHIVEAREGNEGMIASFAKAGVTWRDLHRLSPEQILSKIADALHNIQDPAANVALAVELLGKGGARMAVGLRKGSEELDGLRQKAKTLSDDQLKVLEAAGRKYDAIIAKIKFIAAKGFLGILDGKSAVKEPPKGASEGQSANYGAQAFMGMGGMRPPSHAAPLDDVAVPDAAQNPTLSEEDRRKMANDAAEAKAQAEREAVLNAPSEFVPSDPKTAKQGDEQAKEAIKLRLQEIKTAQQLGDIDADHAERLREETKDIAEIVRKSGYEQLQTEAQLVGITSKLLQNDKEQALVKQQIADNAQRIGDAESDKEAAGIRAENVGLEQRLLALAAQRQQIDQDIARGQREINYEYQNGAIALLEMTDKEAAFKAKVALLEQQIADTNAEAARSDEVRRVELEKQNIALGNQVKTMKQAKAIADFNKTPQQRREEHAEERLNRRAVRTIAARERDAADRAKRNQRPALPPRPPRPAPPVRAQVQPPPFKLQPSPPELKPIQNAIENIDANFAAVAAALNTA
jgi:hypothetical protein